VRHGNDFTVCVCTFNSAKTLERCLRSVKRVTPCSRIIVVDHDSADETARIASSFGAEVFSETRGLGYARQLCVDLTNTEYLVFVDSDVEIIRDDFLGAAKQLLVRNPGCGAVVGMALGHRFAYGLPAGLLVLRKSDFEGKFVPDYVDARETFFILRRLESLGLMIWYLHDSMVHRSQFRKFKPEWEGANTRLLPDFAPRQLLLALETIILLSLNSRSFKTVAYIPLFYLKFLRGFINPAPWVRLNRTGGDVR
jgi:glycosyltransferase involved in cell wall biosynthesis